MSGNQGDGKLSMLAPSQWVHPETGIPTTSFFQLIQGLWSRTGGTQAPANSSGSQGFQVLQNEINNLQAEISGISTSGSDFDIPDAFQPDESQALLAEFPDAPISPSQLQTFIIGSSNPKGLILTAPANLVIESGTVRLNVVNGAVVTVALENLPSGTAPGSGTVISGTVDLSTGLNSNQDIGVIGGSFLSFGESLAIKTTGTIVAASGLLTVSYRRL